MENQKIVVGLDIGTTKICAIVGKKNKFGKLEILGMGNSISDGVTGGVVTNINKTVESINKSIKEAEEEANIDIKVVNVGIAGRHIKSSIQHGGMTRERIETEITLNDVKKLTNDMYKLVTPPGTKIIHVMPQDYIVDNEYDIKDPVGMSGVKLEGNFHVITAETNAINNIYKCIKKNNLEVEELILEPLASSISVLSKDEKEAGVCLVDIGGGTADIAIFHDSVIRHTAVIPFGGDIITEDIKQGFGIMTNQAELLKTKFGRAIADKNIENEIISIPGIRERPPKNISTHSLAMIIEARLGEIIEMIYSNILASGYQDKLAGGIVITGGGAQLAYTRQLFEYITDYDTRLGYPNEHLGGGVELAKSPMYATGVGLVLAGFQELDYREEYYKQSNIINDYNIARSKSKSKSRASSKDFFRRILDKTKGLLIDDYIED
ncbi:MAG: cell division protein FtsA [Bacteroidetes bacterium]|nr:cell division protein FtsA [Bacteroidota bacterium]